MADTKITWTQKVWNPVRGCSKVSPGCANCYAERMAGRFGGPGQPYEGLVRYRSFRTGQLHGEPQGTGCGRAEWTGEARFIPEMLDAPLRWRKPSLVFVNSMSDLFHGDITNEQIAAVFGVMAACPQHTFQILTKRPKRMVEWFEWARRKGSLLLDIMQSAAYRAVPESNHTASMAVARGKGREWPLPNVHLGVSVENQAAADERIPPLLQCHAAVRWVSCEPLLGELDLRKWLNDPCDCLVPALEGAGQHSPSCKTFTENWGLDWIVVGGESGPSARPLHIDWCRSLLCQCKESGVAFFMKQITQNGHKIQMDQWPEDLRVREYPHGKR